MARLAYSARSARLALLSLLVLQGACGPAKGGGQADGGSDAGPQPAYALRDCLTRFRFSDGSPHQRLNLAGSFNDWSETADRLESSDGVHFSLALKLPAGDYAYHVLVDGSPRLDPINHRRSFASGDERSRVVVDGCGRPRLVGDSFKLVSQGAGAALSGSLQLEAHFEAVPEGGPERALDPAMTRLWLDGQLLVGPQSQQAFDGRGLLSMKLTGLAAGKHRLRVEGADLAGRSFEALVASGWVEATPFEWRDALIYFPMTDRFRNGDPSLDAPVGTAPIADYAGGDYAGILSAIQDGSFEALGVNTLWLSPPYKGPAGDWAGADGHRHAGYHGYWPASPRKSEPRFGSLETLQALTAAAHAKGMRVLADLIFNHVHESHPYASRPGFVHETGKCVCGRPGCDWETHAKSCWFTDYLPDLDWKQDAVSDAMVADALYWYDVADLDGFRVDAVKHFERRALSDLRAGLERARPFERQAQDLAVMAGSAQVVSSGSLRPYLLGETFTGEGDVASLLPALGTDALDGQFDFSLVWTLLRVFARGEGNFVDLENALEAEEAALPADALMSPFLGNHDLARFGSQCAGDIADLYGVGAKAQGWNAPPAQALSGPSYDKAALAFAFLLTAPGAPLIYYGDELGLAGAGDPDNRRPMPADRALPPVALALRDKVRALGRLRARLPALRRGARSSLFVEPDLWVQLRKQADGAFAIVVLNRAPVAVDRRVPLSGLLGSVPRLSLKAELGGGTLQLQNGQLQVRLPARGYEVYTPLP